MLIAITLIASIAVAGFVFGLFGTFISTALVSAGSVSCSGTPEVCVIPLQNSGSANTALSGVCTLAFGGGSYVSTATLLSGSLNAGSTATISCTTPGSLHANSGSQVVGSVSLGNGAYVLFAALTA